MAELLGTFELIIVLAVANLGEGAYGRSVLREAQSAVTEERNVAAGAVYATLDRLEAKGYLSSQLGEGTAERGGRARRYYRITSEGAVALGQTRKTLETMWQRKPLEAWT